jgi:hypothetical protein
MPNHDLEDLALVQLVPKVADKSPVSSYKYGRYTAVRTCMVDTGESSDVRDVLDERLIFVIGLWHSTSC